MRAGVTPEDRRRARPGIASWTTIAAMNPTNAAVSIIPSMPMLTMPLRSFITPHSAPSAIGVASWSVWARQVRREDRVDQVGEELEDEAEDRDAEQDVHQTVVSP